MLERIVSVSVSATFVVKFTFAVKISSGCAPELECCLHVNPHIGLDSKRTSSNQYAAFQALKFGDSTPRIAEKLPRRAIVLI
jgi:hypothetical protein